METGTNQKLFLIVLLSLSVVLTGCSRQLYTSLVSSEDKSLQSLASLSGSSPIGGQVSQPSQSKSDDLLQGGESEQMVMSGSPVETSPLPRLSDSSIDSFSLVPHNPQSGSNTEFSTSQISESDSFFSSSDEIIPLDDKDLLTEIAAASGTGGSTRSATEAFSSRQKGGTLTPLGDELFGEGNLGDIFFDFDAVAILSDAASTLHANAQILTARLDNRRVVIEGHCDERGTAEYNLVLGERRAQSTKQYLVDLGVSDSAIQTISYGKEKPFCTASHPDCWQLNRRGHFVLQ